MSELKSYGYKLASKVMLALLALALFPALPIQAQATGLTPPTVPDKLKAPQGEVPILKAAARGVQIYTCKANATDATKFEWTLKAPEADLFNERGEKIGSHYAGPTWESTEGGKVVGEVKERADAPGGTAIPWLLLKAKSNEGNGIFSKVTSVQRLETVAGLAPAATACEQSKKDTEVRVGYSATYYFYVPAAVASQFQAGVPGTGLGDTKAENSSPNLLLVIGLGVALIGGLAGLIFLARSYRSKGTR